VGELKRGLPRHRKAGAAFSESKSSEGELGW
jgi:hypothetical protein